MDVMKNQDRGIMLAKMGGILRTCFNRDQGMNFNQA